MPQKQAFPAWKVQRIIHTGTRSSPTFSKTHQWNWQNTNLFSVGNCKCLSTIFWKNKCLNQNSKGKLLQRETTHHYYFPFEILLYRPFKFSHISSLFSVWVSSKTKEKDNGEFLDPFACYLISLTSYLWYRMPKAQVPGDGFFWC